MRWGEEKSTGLGGIISGDLDANLAGEEPADGEHVHGCFDDAVSEPVFADSCGSWSMVYWPFGDAESHSFDERWDESVHPVEGNKCVSALGSHDFEGAASVTHSVFGES